MSSLSLHYNHFPFSVLLSVYAKTQRNHLSECLNSIWHVQTIKPSQIVLVIDGPIIDSLSELIELWEHKLNSVFDVVPLSSNLGLASALNIGLSYCKYELVARMDTDDVAVATRFEQQVLFMASNPDVDVLSGFVEEYNDDMTHSLSIRRLPLRHSKILSFCKFRNPISHPAVMYKKSVVLSVGGYPSIYPEDYPLWGLLLASGFRFANLDSILVKMRTEESFNSRRGLTFLVGQLHCFWIFRKIGLFGWLQFLLSTSIVIFLRMSPSFLRKFLYSRAR